MQKYVYPAVGKFTYPIICKNLVILRKIIYPAMQNFVYRRAKIYFPAMQKFIYNAKNLLVLYSNKGIL